MSIGLTSSFVTVLSVLVICCAYPSSAQSIEEELPVLVDTLAKQLVARKKVKVAALDFTDIQGRPNELGRFLAEQMSVELVMAQGITVIDRANLSAIMAEHKLTAEGLVDPQNARKLGQFSGVEAIIVGNVTPIDSVILLTVRAISTDTSELLAAGRMRIAASDSVRRMLGLSVSASASTASASIASAAPSDGASRVPSISVGPLRAIIKSVNTASAQRRGGRNPDIHVAIKFENPNLNTSVAVAANSEVTSQYGSAPKTERIFGSLQDSSGRTWILNRGALGGIPQVYCFDIEARQYISRPRITQNAPSNVVDYIRRGNEYDGSDLRAVTGRMWAGSFASIEPGGSLDVTLTFSPSKELERGGYSFQSDTSHGSFEFSLELVLATHQEGERPEKARDLALKTLRISDISLRRAVSNGGR